MLVITQTTGSDPILTLKLEGKLVGPWIAELELVCGGLDLAPERLRLELAGLTFVDEEGARFLRNLMRCGTRVVGSSPFIAEMLQLERRQ
jgi:hypothetical protein